eukprot:6305217-Amphidinium_carterae.1
MATAYRNSDCIHVNCNAIVFFLLFPRKNALCFEMVCKLMLWRMLVRNSFVSMALPLPVPTRLYNACNLLQFYHVDCLRIPFDGQAAFKEFFQGDAASIILR